MIAVAPAAAERAADRAHDCVDPGGDPDVRLRHRLDDQVGHGGERERDARAEQRPADDELPRVRVEQRHDAERRPDAHRAEDEHCPQPEAPGQRPGDRAGQQLRAGQSAPSADPRR